MRCGGKDCQECYVGETKQALGARMNQHRRPSSNPAQTSAVYTHLKSTCHAFSLENIAVHDREEQWHRRGVKEAIWERVENPSLSKKGEIRHALSHTWDRAVKMIDSRLSRDTPRQVTGCQLPDRLCDTFATSSCLLDLYLHVNFQ